MLNLPGRNDKEERFDGCDYLIAPRRRKKKRVGWSLYYREVTLSEGLK
jgi:hypothetical protein